jgi:prepilin-type N-terminal cleavage/methylation domain-containing protein
MKTVPAASGNDGFGLLETLVAITVLTIGLLAASGLSSSATRLVTSASVLADQTAAAEAVFERIRQAGYAAALSGADTVVVGSARYGVEITVTNWSPTAKEIVLTVAGRRWAADREFTTWMANAGSFPPPAALSILPPVP